jgi:FdhD protein
MRTPGHDFELAVGFLSGEGIITNREDITDVAYSSDVSDEAERKNTVQVTLRSGLELDIERQKRNFTITSACGVCGKASLDALVADGCRPLRNRIGISATVLGTLPETLRASQGGFEATGGLHACGLFSTDGELVSLREDVGRHNAFDKLIGEQFLAGNMQQLQEMTVLLSGRASYELLQKALRARIPIVAAVGAPSTLAIEIAESFGITLAGFVKKGGFNVYAGRERIVD